MTSALPRHLLALSMISILSLVAAGLVACAEQGSRQGEPRRTRELVREVLSRHHDSLMGRYDAVGVGLGKRQLEDEEYVIVVYLAAPLEEPTDDVALEGVPVIFRITGRIQPLPPGQSAPD